MPSVRLDLSHGAVEEIADVYGCTHDILHSFFPDMSAEDWKDVVKKITTQTKMTMSTDNIETEGEGKNLSDDSIQCNLLGNQMWYCKGKYRNYGMKLKN